MMKKLIIGGIAALAIDLMGDAGGARRPLLRCWQVRGDAEYGEVVSDYKIASNA